MSSKTVQESFTKKFLENCHNPENHLPTIAYLANLDVVMQQNQIVGEAIVQELHDQRNSLKLIASENYSSLSVQLAMGNLLTDKYAEGHTFHRFYAGCGNVDAVEAEAANAAKELFGAEHAYVQPHSGADANLIAFWGILIKRVESKAIADLGKTSIYQLSKEEYEVVRRELTGQKMLGMSLDCGGHLTHGSPVNISSKIMQAFAYGVDPTTHLIDYKKIEEIAMREKPAILLAGYSAYPRLIDFAIMKEIASKVGATLMIDMAHFAGLVAGGALKGNFHPVPFGDVITSTTHKTLRGPRGGLILSTEEYRECIDKGCPHVIGGPLPHMMAAKALAFREALQPSFKSYAKQVLLNAKALAERLLSHKVELITGGTDNHLVLLNVHSTFGLTGRHAESALTLAKISTNRNLIPNDPNGPWYTAGLRIGTPALTSRGLKEKEMQEIADLIYTLLKASSPESDPVTGKVSLAKVKIDEKVLHRVQDRVTELLKGFPLYPEIVV